MTEKTSRLIDRIGSFTAIPNSVIKMWPEIGTDAISLFLFLRYRTNAESDVAFPGYKDIRATTGWNFSRIAKAIRKLESAGLLARHKRFGSSTIYELLIPASATASVAQSYGVGSTVLPASVEEQDLSNKTDYNNTSFADAQEGDSHSVNGGDRGHSELPGENGKKERQLTDRQKAIKELEEYFADLTGIKLPPRANDGQRKFAAKFWWNVLAEMWDYYCEMDIGRTKALIKKSIDAARESKYRVSTPASIQKTFIALHSGQDAQGQKKHPIRVR